MKVQIYGEQYDLCFRKLVYTLNDNLAVQVLYDEEGIKLPFCMLTTNIVGCKLKEDEAFIDINNCPQGIVQNLENEGKISFLEVTTRSGFCDYPLYKFNKDWLESIS